MCEYEFVHMHAVSMEAPNKCGMGWSVKDHQMLEKLGEISVRERLQHWHVWGLPKLTGSHGQQKIRPEALKKHHS